MTRYVINTLLVVAVLIAGVGFYQRYFVATAPPEKPKGVQRQTNSAPLGSVTADKPSQAAVPLGLPQSALTKEFAHANSYLQFIERVKNKPEEGGQYYAYQAARQCLVYNNSKSLSQEDRDVPYDPNESQAVAVKRQAARQKLAALCSDVSKQLHSELANQLKPLPGSQKYQDVLQHMWSDLYGSGSVGKGDRLAAINNFINKPDAMMLYQDTLRLLQKNESEQYVFDGKTYSANVTAMASQLVACDLGYPCGPQNLDVLTFCSQAGRCFDSFEQQLQAIASPGDFAQVTALQSAIVSALLAKDPQPFTRSAGSSVTADAK